MQRPQTPFQGSGARLNLDMRASVFQLTLSLPPASIGKCALITFRLGAPLHQIEYDVLETGLVLVNMKDHISPLMQNCA